MIFLDTETCGLHGVAVLIQWAFEDGEIHLFSPWTNRIKDTLRLIEFFCEHEEGVCCYNMAFDWFHLQKLYTIFSLYPDHDAYPEFLVDDLAELELQAMEGPCVKPKKALDLMLFAMRGPYQSTMERKDIVIRKVPAILADKLAAELEDRIDIPGIYFSRKKKREQVWTIRECRRDGEVVPHFRNVVLSFAASRGLKNVAVDALGINPEEVLKFADVEIPKNLYPNEVGWAPYAMAHGKRGDWKRTWPSVVQFHIDHWLSNAQARKYAELDVVYLRGLYNHFGRPPAGDDDSTLACCVASCRWRGYPLNLPKIKKMAEGLEEVVKTAPKDHHAVKRMLLPLLTEQEKLAMHGSTRKDVLENIATWQEDDGKPTPAAKLCQEILAARKAQKQLEICKKLLQAKKLHASFRVIGTLSGRMSGSDGLNAHGINKSDTVRENFKMHRDADYAEFMKDYGVTVTANEILSGGDFKSYEVTLADAVYGDKDLRNDLLSGKKIHALFGQYGYTHMTYEQIVESDGKEPDYYTKCKQAFFALLYGATPMKLAKVLGISEEAADLMYRMFVNRYKDVGVSRAKLIDSFCSMRQPKIGGAIFWKDPVDFIESLLGFKRYFTLENKITKSLFEMAQNPPSDWLAMKVRVKRRQDGTTQFAGNAVRSALYGAAFGIQASNMRAGLNHVIQATGAGICKRVQCAIWELQPAGIHPFVVQPGNFHDEINSPSTHEAAPKMAKIVKETVESYRSLVPLIGINWLIGMHDWSGKHEVAAA